MISAHPAYVSGAHPCETALKQIVLELTGTEEPPCGQWGLAAHGLARPRGWCSMFLQLVGLSLDQDCPHPLLLLLVKKGLPAITSESGKFFDKTAFLEPYPFSEIMGNKAPGAG